MTDDTWYFAYGSNLCSIQKSERTRPTRVGDERPRIATLKDYRLAFNKRGSGGNVVANIMPCPGDEVMGVVYRWDSESRETMAREYEIGYVEKFVEVTTELDEQFTAVTFVASERCICEEGRPSADHLQRIVTGARWHELPEESIRKIESLATGQAD